MGHPTPGIRRRRSVNCPARKDRSARCQCSAGYEASVWDAAAEKKIRGTFQTAAAPRAGRADALNGVHRDTLVAARTPATVNDAADDLIAGIHDGIIRTRSGDPYKPSTARSYDQGLRDHVCPALGAMRLGEVKRRHVRHLVDRLVADDLSPSTVKNAINPLRVIFRRAIRDELVAVDPCAGLDLPANRGRRLRVVAVETVAHKIALLPTPFDRAIWATAFYAGLRRGELVALRWRNVDLDAGHVSVEQSYDPPSRTFGPPKSDAGVRRVPITAALRRALLEHRVAFGRIDSDALVFGVDGKPVDGDTVLDTARETWAAVAVGAFVQGRNLEVPLEEIDLHTARHTCASVMIAAGVNIKALSEFMGHSSITITLDWYGHLLPGSLAEAARCWTLTWSERGELAHRPAHETRNPCSRAFPYSLQNRRSGVRVPPPLLRRKVRALRRRLCDVRVSIPGRRGRRRRSRHRRRLG